jgi:hypothetical protein
MKKLIFLTTTLFFLSYCLKAQQGNTPAAQLAHHIANKMADTLGLSNQQRAKIFTINMDLFNQKKDARERSQNRDQVAIDLQKIEAQRDSLYKVELTEAQYLLYLKKKKNLVTSQ